MLAMTAAWTERGIQAEVVHRGCGGDDRCRGGAGADDLGGGQAIFFGVMKGKDINRVGWRL